MESNAASELEGELEGERGLRGASSLLSSAGFLLLQLAECEPPACVGKTLHSFTSRFLWGAAAPDLFSQPFWVAPAVTVVAGARGSGFLPLTVG